MNIKKSSIHQPVMLDEVIENLHIKNQAKYIDATLGAGGYSAEIIKNGGVVLGIEYDPVMIAIAKKNLEKACPVRKNFSDFFQIQCGNFSEIGTIAKANGFESVDGIVFDLGLSSYQLDFDNRGFSFRRPNDPIDMRLNPKLMDVTAADLLNVLRKDQLVDLFNATDYKYSEKLANLCLEKRQVMPFEKVSDFLDIVAKVSPFKPRRIHPATLPMMALRMAVNNELDNLTKALEQSVNLLLKGGRILVVSFHSGEDRVVKSVMRSFQMRGLGKIITKRPLRPKPIEIKDNLRSRSAKLRIFEK